MSTEHHTASGSDGNNASLQHTTVGGSKPLHRFHKGQPKIVGIVVLILGVSFIIISISIQSSSGHQFLTAFSPGLLVGSLCITCGILFILTEHNTTKKTVTISLALSIISIIGAFWCAMHITLSLGHGHYYRQYDYSEDNANGTDDVDWEAHAETFVFAIEVIFAFYSFVGVVIFIGMSSLAGAALRSTKSQAVVVMTTAPMETPLQ